MSGALLSALERKDTCSADRVARLVPDAAARYRAVIEGLPRANLPPDELSRARGLIHRFLGGPGNRGAERCRTRLGAYHAGREASVRGLRPNRE